ncbi:hypothetical protein CIT26_01375 [Mesorhizobium temperatum]|uniref:Uncharacterized protein n=1 Tax=Mesorhizobium temperatum TaxID=241416 RepID=A0A271LYL3_9HYPH|nr:hypothetical protein CIT26_01375 [Mesorhizobium temperatum]
MLRERRLGLANVFALLHRKWPPRCGRRLTSPYADALVRGLCAGYCGAEEVAILFVAELNAGEGGQFESALAVATKLTLGFAERSDRAC